MSAKVKTKTQDAPQKVTTENLTALCWSRGFKGVPSLARKIHRSRVTLWRAVRWPDQFRPTYNLIEKHLCE